MGKEIERRFLINKLPSNLDQLPHLRIQQGYPAPHERVRKQVSGKRKKKEEFSFTTKNGNGLVRKEDEDPISEKKFYKLWKRSKGKRLRKIRHLKPHGRHTIEIDLFLRKLSGFQMAEVEFTSVKQAKAFRPPSWLGPEVTENRNFTNRSLATHGIPIAELKRLRRR